MPLPLSLKKISEAGNILDPGRPMIPRLRDKRVTLRRDGNRVIEISTHARRVFWQAARAYSLKLDVTTIAIREHLEDVALLYEKLAEGVEAGYHVPN